MEPAPARPGSLVVFLVVLVSACMPPFSDLQSARLVGPGRYEVTPGISSGYVSADGESRKLQNHFGVRMATGLTPRVDVRLGFESVSMVDGAALDEGYGVVGAGPKIGLIEDRVALYAPVGFAFGEDIESSDSWQFQPTVLFTGRYGNVAEVTASGRGVVWLNSELYEGGSNANLFGGNLGLGPDLDRWAFRSEIGFLRFVNNPDEDGTLWQWSMGFTAYGGRAR